ncbi:hypothetical protein WN944_020979 [Citrus x changshan-huyou]|uniref:Uncharacterized protein n=1 Tax=Citrus x changshan-huyou TaxID=2935761 RepID=A0AAP0MW08_9ROSI
MSKRLIVSSHNHHQGGHVYSDSEDLVPRIEPHPRRQRFCQLHCIGNLIVGRCLSSPHPTKNRLFLIDTLALVRKLEAEGVPSKQAESELLCLFLPRL